MLDEDEELPLKLMHALLAGCVRHARSIPPPLELARRRAAHSELGLGWMNRRPQTQPRDRVMLAVAWGGGKLLGEVLSGAASASAGGRQRRLSEPTLMAGVNGAAAALGTRV